MSRAAREIVRAETSRVGQLRRRLAEVEVPRNQGVRPEFRYRQLLAAGGRLERFVQSAARLELDLGPQRRRATRELRLLEATLQDTAKADLQSIADVAWPVRVPGFESHGTAVDEALEAQEQRAAPSNRRGGSAGPDPAERDRSGEEVGRRCRLVRDPEVSKALPGCPLAPGISG